MNARSAAVSSSSFLTEDHVETVRPLADASFHLLECFVEVEPVPHPNPIDGNRMRQPAAVHKFKELRFSHAEIGCRRIGSHGAWSVVIAGHFGCPKPHI